MRPWRANHMLGERRTHMLALAGGSGSSQQHLELARAAEEGSSLHRHVVCQRGPVQSDRDRLERPLREFDKGFSQLHHGRVARHLVHGGRCHVKSGAVALVGGSLPRALDFDLKSSRRHPSYYYSLPLLRPLLLPPRLYRASEAGMLLIVPASREPATDRTPADARSRLHDG